MSFRVHASPKSVSELGSQVPLVERDKNYNGYDAVDRAAIEGHDKLRDENELSTMRKIVEFYRAPVVKFICNIVSECID